MFGSGVPVVITGGAREPLDVTRSLAEKLGRKYRVILWDRATIGRSDIQLKGPRDLELWATQLAGLLDRLGAGPAYLVAASNGARTSMVAALRYPEITKGMFLFLVTGGGSKGLGDLFSETADAAETGGIDAVLAMDYWAERICDNPANRGILRAMPVDELIRTTRRWANAFDTTYPITGLSADDLARIKVRTRILDATEPTTLLTRAGAQLAKLLPNTELITDDEFQEEWSALFKKLGSYQGHYTEPASLARLIDRFVQDFEARGAG
jgi:pimeloyl-ACP methyl ester carboxylesterase